MLTSVPIHLVRASDRVRKAGAEKVSKLADSIRLVGLLNPITVYGRDVHVDGKLDFVPGYGIVAGLHRLEACRYLGHTEIAANVVDLDDLHRQLAECDENLCGTNLSTAERAKFTARRKQAYEALHPETRHGGDRKSCRQVGDMNKDRFTAATSAATGKPERVVQRDAARGEKIDEALLDEIAGTDLDRGVVLDQIAKAPQEKQRAVIEEMKKAKAAVPAPKQPKPRLTEDEIIEKKCAPHIRWWETACPAERAKFLAECGLEYRRLAVVGVR